MKVDFLAFERRLLTLPVGGQLGLLLLRLLLASTLLLRTLLALPVGWARLLPPVYAAAALLVYRLRKAGKLSDAAGAGMFLMDLAACLLVALFVEGQGNGLYTTLLLLILSSCLLRKPALVLGVSAAATVLYGLVVLPSPPMSGDNLRLFYERLTLFFLITLFGVHIADYAGQIERETARRFEERLAWMQRLSMVGQAMAAVLHEAKTPLGTILLSAESGSEALRQGRKPEEELKVIAEEAGHATAVLQNFLDFVRPTRLERRPLRLQEPLLQAAAMARIRLEEAGVELTLKTLEACRVLGSSRHLVQAFSNILHNAADAMPQGGQLRVRMEADGGRAKVHVEDTGAGMGPEALARLFEPFASSKAEEGGHGLGLSIVRWILQEHDGDVLVESAGPGKGTHVTLVLPLLTESFVAKS